MGDEARASSTDGRELGLIAYCVYILVGIQTPFPHPKKIFESFSTRLFWAEGVEIR